MTGFVVTRNTSSKVLSDTCEMSTIMPMVFISRTTCLPNSVSPLCSGFPVDESAQSLLRKWVSVMDKIPKRRYIRRTAKSLSI